MRPDIIILLVFGCGLHASFSVYIFTTSLNIYISNTF